MRAETSCGLCGKVEVRSDLWLDQPQTDDEYDTALAIVATLHEIAEHLDDIEPEPAA